MVGMAGMWKVSNHSQFNIQVFIQFPLNSKSLDQSLNACHSLNFDLSDGYKGQLYEFSYQLPFLRFPA